MFCKKCGAELPYNSKACKVCGSIINAGINFQTEKSGSTQAQSTKNSNENLNKLLEDILAEVKEKPEAYATYKPQSQSGATTTQLRPQTMSPQPRPQTIASQPRPQPTHRNTGLNDLGAGYKTTSQTGRINPAVKQNNFSKNQEQDEWLDPEAVREIWGTQNTNPKPVQQQRYQQPDEMLPDGTPDWLKEIRAEEQEKQKPRFSLANHPLIAGTIMTFTVMAICAIAIVVIWNF